MQEYNICYSLDREYTEQLCASLASVLVNSEIDENINIFLLEGGLREQDKLQIETLKNIKNFNVQYFNINNNIFSDCPMLCDKGEEYKNYHVTMPTYYRFLLPDLLPDLDKILYLDCDVIVRSSLKELINENFENRAAIMGLDAESEKNSLRLNINKYFNAGVMLINLDFWRNNNIKNKLFDFAKNNADKILWQDQDIINAVLSSEIKEISNKWNYQYFQYEDIDFKKAGDAAVIHLAGRFKPWLMPFESEIYDLYYEYLKLTPFKNKITEYRLNASGKRLRNNIGGSVTNIVLNAYDKDLDKCFKEINKSYNYTEEQIVSANAETDGKISKVYNNISENISKCYDYTNSQFEIVNNHTESKVSEVFDKISNVIIQTDSKIANVISQTDSKISNVYDEVSKNYKFTENLANEKEVNITKETDLKFSEIYSYTNSHVSTLYKEVKNASSNIEHNINHKINDIYNFNTQINEQIENLKREVAALPKNEAINSLSDNFKKITEENNLKYSLQIDCIKSDFEEKLNEQRIKYERKLIDMENQLNDMNLLINEFMKEMKKTPFEKLKEKFRKKK